MDWWREARFGMFIHWGLYSVAGGQWEGKRCNIIASWIASEFRIPPDQYDSLMSGFTADRFDPAAWAALAKKAGMKYAVLTAKHHEGFCLFDSKLTDYDVMNTPAGRDVVREYLDAFHHAGLKAGLYYSVIDWHHPDYQVKGDANHPMRDDPAYQMQDRDLSKYIDYMHAQVRELLTGYGPIDEIWWDFSYGNMTGEAWRAKELEAMCRDLQPGIIMNNRLYAGTENPHGDFATPEQHIPANGLPGVDWETCMTINTTWGYKPHDLDFKSSLQLIRNLVDIVSKGGNYLLNIGPRADGSIPQDLVERLEAIGTWMDVNSEAIYGTTASPFRAAPPWGRVTTKSVDADTTRLYLHVFDWPVSRTILVPPLENHIKRVTLLDGGEELTFTTGENGTTIYLPAQPRHEAATVLLMDIVGPPLLASIKVKPDATGRYILTADAAQLHGSTISYPSSSEEDSIGYWNNSNDWISWNLTIPSSGRYNVEITYGCKGAGGEYVIEIGDQKLEGKTESTGDWFTRRTDTPGSLELPVGVSVQLAVRIKGNPGSAVMDIKQVELNPRQSASL